MIIKDSKISLQFVAGQILNWVAMSEAFGLIAMELNLFTWGGSLYMKLALPALTGVAKPMQEPGLAHSQTMVGSFLMYLLADEPGGAPTHT